MSNDAINCPPLVAIGVATYKRPRFLHDLLECMRRAELDNHLFRAHLIVADNDATESARSIVESFVEEFPIPITYVVEPTRGIASARNRLVREAAKLGADYISFVDDDVLVDSSWLKELVKIAQTMPVSAVTGVIAGFLFETEIPEWVRNSNFWIPEPRGATGTRVRHFGTTNVLLKMSALKQIPGPFDERCNLTGGSDLVLSECLYRRGYQSVLCAESKVYERVPASRANASWMIRRGWRSGLNHGYLCREYETSRRGRLVFILGGLARVAKHSALLLVGVRRGRAGIVAPFARLVRGCGFLAGLFGMSYEEYRITHGQ